jgi:fatty-acyl-CoA synthase
MERVMDDMGASQITIGYGLTEASPIITQTSVDDPIEVRVSTVGRPIPGIEVRLVDRDGRAVPPGQAGELCVRGHNVMAGYYNDPAATARVLEPDGWLHSGDLGLLRDDGNYRIVGRVKEIIIRGGENIYPPEVEDFPAVTPRSPRSPSSAFPTASTARSFPPGSSPAPALRSMPPNFRNTAKARSLTSKYPGMLKLSSDFP